MTGPKIAPRPPHLTTLLSPESDGDGRAASRLASDKDKHVRTKITTACQVCQKRKVKCDGNQPCATCIRLRESCTYLRLLDGRVGVFKRKFSEVQHDQNLLHDLLRTIRDTTDDHVAQIISTIRNGTDLDEVKAGVAQQLVESHPDGRQPSFESLRLQSDLHQLSQARPVQEKPSVRSDILQIQRLCHDS